MTPALKKVLSLRQHEIAKALGGKLGPGPCACGEPYCKTLEEHLKKQGVTVN